MNDEPQGGDNPSSRRDFLKTTTAVAAGSVLAANLAMLSNVHAAGSGSGNTLKVGLIGCGNRGTGAAGDCVLSSPNVKLVAMADIFKDRLNGGLAALKTQEKRRIDNGKKAPKNTPYHYPRQVGDHIAVPQEQMFDGLDAFKRLLKCDVDLVIQATPPGFRPLHVPAIIAAGKHLFTEKPVGTDVHGIKTILGAYDLAKRKNLAVVAGTQRRHESSYLESMKRIHGGEIGDIVAARCYWNQGSLWVKEREKGWSDLEYQIRNWLYFCWLSGDHICEQHVHNLDVINWAMQSHPLRAVGMGGRQVRVEPKYGNIYDHFAIDYEYPNGVHCMSMCRQIEGCEGNVSEALVGTKGMWTPNAIKKFGQSKGWRFPRGGENRPYVQEHHDLIASIREGKPLNELKTVAESTLTAIMGRMSAYTGKAITWEEALKTDESLLPSKIDLKASIPVPPVPMPGS